MKLVHAVVLIDIGGLKMKVKRIQKTNKKLPVYDLEVPKTHNFILKNGVVVHNCRYALEKFWKRRGN